MQIHLDLNKKDTYSQTWRFIPIQTTRCNDTYNLIIEIHAFI